MPNLERENFHIKKKHIKAEEIIVPRHTRVADRAKEKRKWNRHIKGEIVLTPTVKPPDDTATLADFLTEEQKKELGIENK